MNNNDNNMFGQTFNEDIYENQQMGYQNQQMGYQGQAGMYPNQQMNYQGQMGMYQDNNAQIPNDNFDMATISEYRTKIKRNERSSKYY